MPLVVQCYGKVSDRDFVLSRLKPLGLEIGASLDKKELDKMQQNRTKVDKVNMQPDEILSVPLSRDDLPLSDPPEGLVSELYKHQRQALSWMLDREKVKESSLFWQKKGSKWFNSATNSVVDKPPMDCRGGIIGDEMGLGKTLEIISLILASKNEQLASGAPSPPTLIICPLSTLSNWSDQIAKHCARNKLTVYLYHGGGRTGDANLLSSYDIVVTTYNIVGLEYSSNNRQQSPLYTIKWKRVVLDEAHLIKNRTTQQSQAVWVLRAECKWCLTGTPIQNKIDDLYSLIRFIQLEPFMDHIWWNRLITRPIKNKDLNGYSRLKTILQHVILRRTKDKHINLPPRNVYLQTLDFSVEERAYYDSIYRFGKAQFDQYAKDGSVLQHYAHVLELLLRLRQSCNHPDLIPSSSYIGSNALNNNTNNTNNNTNNTNNINDNTANNTNNNSNTNINTNINSYNNTNNNDNINNINNNTSNVYMNSTSLNNLNHNTTSTRNSNDNFSLNHNTNTYNNNFTNNNFTNNFTNNNNPYIPNNHTNNNILPNGNVNASFPFSNPAYPSENNSNTTSLPLPSSHSLPPPNHTDINGNHTIYPPNANATLNFTNPNMNNSGNFTFSTNTPRETNIYNEPNGNTNTTTNTSTINDDATPKRIISELIKTGELDECCICMDKAIDPVVTKCVHIFCRTCIFQAISLSGNSCPLCRSPVLPRELQSVKFDETEETIKTTVTNRKSSKVNALILDLLAVRQRDPTIKSIIFSQFTSFLNIIEHSLTANNIKFVRLDGKMSHEQRNDSMQKFETDPSITVFLLSLKAGGVGLNLVAASRVYMMDPWWNPAVEDQAIDRVHRLGQTRPVEVIRFVIKGTVEEKIMKLQERKMKMAQSALEAKSRAELQHMRLDDLNLLFSN